ncbi:angiogenic factor with G patch and FHA domains 1 [Phlebotomus argentipes]|uniref:angiogenic factor with G patch and FHA domains 1 n=1 Tax=Phlebotomus argentipes TaxID=94469 RepID=UPI0028935680|nr:angiogenic factor with G patch and FHA domains 1 [Phlebotomus argentipes]
MSDCQCEFWSSIAAFVFPSILFVREMKKHSLGLPRPLSYAKIQNFSKTSLLFYIKCLHKIISRERVVLTSFRKKNRKLETQMKSLKCQEETPAKVETEDPLKFVQEIKSVAEEAQRVAGFVYEPVSGLYYDNKTGYYYNADLRLYYDGNTGVYYSYDAATNQFLYHSQVYTDGKENNVVSLISEMTGEKKESQSVRRRHKKRRKSPEKVEKPKEDVEMEDGEVLSSPEESEEEEKLSGDAVRYAPSLRLIVQESAVESVSAGTLFVITCRGGTLGREGHHDILIPDLNVSKHHLKFIYNDAKSTYQIIDLGSTNGTILNSQRMTTSKRESDPVDLLHDSVIELSGTRLLCHVHGGSETCDDCHPGLLKATQKTASSAAESQSLEQSRLQIQKRLQKKYGLATEKYEEPKSFAGEAYVDRAANRRVTVGSSHDGEKTEVASTEWAISRKNKGFKLLSQMGWSEGQSLGNTEEALKEPISVVGNQGTAGLGYGS